MNGKNTILITGAGGAASIFLIHHLHKNNFRVVAVDSNPHAAGLLHADANYIVPLCTANNYMEVIEKICSKENISFIIPLIDEELLLLKRFETKKIKVICPSEEFIKTTIDKFSLTKALSNISVYVPETFLMSEDYSSITFPAVIKPRSGRGSRDVFFINNIDELNKFLSQKRDFLNDFLIQKKIEGDEYTVSVVVNPDNQLIAVVPKRIIEKKGITKAAITEVNDGIQALCERIVKELVPCNPFNVQLMVSKNDKMPYVFEINPRYSTTTTLTIVSGVDEIMIPLNYYIYPGVKTPLNLLNNMVLLRSINEQFLSAEEYERMSSNIISLQ